MNLSRILTIPIFVFSFWILLGVPARAEPLGYEIRLGGMVSDNVARTSILEEDEAVALVGVQIEVDHESQHLKLGVLSDLEYRDYLDDTFDQEVMGALNAEMVAMFAPETFEWVIEDQFGVLQVDPFRADTAGNRENVNRFSTGPNLRVRLGSNIAFEGEGRYFTNRFEVSPTDNDVLHGSVSIVRALSAHRSVALTAARDEYEFKDQLINSDYDKDSAYINFASEVSRGKFFVILGYNSIALRGDTSDGPLAIIRFERLLSPSTTLSFDVRQGLTDASEAIGNLQRPGLGFGETQNISGVGDPFEQIRADMELLYARNASRLYVAASIGSEDYITNQDLDRDHYEVRAGLERTVATAWRVRINGSFKKNQFAGPAREDDDVTLGAGLSRLLSKRLSVTVAYNRFDRSSSEATFDYAENVASLFFTYGTLNLL